jgi:hypothetical protein
VIVTRERMEAALDALARTDEQIAEARTEVKRQEYVLKRKEAHAFLSCTGGVKERECLARVDADVISAYNAHTDALEKYERLAAKRQTEALIIDVWRSLESSRRVGT